MDNNLCYADNSSEMEFEDPTKLTVSLAKVLSYFCDGHVKFDSWAQVTGYLCLVTGSGQSIAFSVNEKICKIEENNMKINTNSYHFSYSTGSGNTFSNCHNCKGKTSKTSDQFDHQPNCSEVENVHP